VITARCGTGLAEIEAAMRERGQMLAFEPPRFGADATFGGMVAAEFRGRAARRRCAARFRAGRENHGWAGDVLSFGGQ